MTSPDSPESNPAPEGAAGGSGGGAGGAGAGAGGAGAGGKRRLPRPSRRQTWLTVGLLAIVVGTGIFALVSKSGGTPGASPGTGSPARAGGTSTVAASGEPTSTVPGSSGRAAAAAANLEIGLRSAIGGCWDDAEPGAANGAYRQDYHHPRGSACGGPGWDIAVQFFASPQAAVRAVRTISGPQTAYTAGYNLIVLAGDASAATRRAVASRPGVQPG